MTVALIPEPVDRTALEAEIAGALADPDARIFLDTSTLIWAYRLHEAARTEFLDWLENGPPPGRTSIPRRALHELSRYRHNTAVLFPFKQRLSRLPALLRQLDEWAHLITDDDRAKAFGFRDRIEYFDLLDNVRENLDRALKPVTSGADQQNVEAQLIPFFNSAAMKGDIHSSLAELQSEYVARAEMRIPPGFEDRNKGGGATSGEIDETTESGEILTGANRFGDFAIWSEIVAGVAAAEARPSTVVLITHDQKRDWLYIPAKIVDLDGRTKSNSNRSDRVTMAHPLLAKELFDKTGVDHLYILTVPQLAQIASRQDIGATLIELGRAVQVEALEQGEEISRQTAGDGEQPRRIEVTITDGIAVQDEVSAEVTPTAPIAGAVPQDDQSITQMLQALPRSALHDRLYRRDPRGDRAADAAIHDLMTHNWYTQNPAANAALALLRSETPSNIQTFVLGRNMYQSACGGAGTPINILDNLEQELRTVDETKANLFYAGALFEAYFDPNGALREHPKSEKIDALFSLQDDPRYRPAVEWLRDSIGERCNRYLALPNPSPDIKELQVAFDPQSGSAVAIRLGDLDLSEATNDGVPSFLGSKLSYERLLKRISRHFDVPEWMFTVDPTFEGERDFSGIRLRQWGPATDFKFE